MSESKKKPTTLKGILALVGAGLLYLVSQVLGIDLSALTGDKSGDAGKPVVTAPAEGGATKEVAKKEPKTPPATGGQKGGSLTTQKPKAPEAEKPAKKQRDDTAKIKQYFQTMQSDAQVEAEGVVSRLLADDLDDHPHQRFLVRLSNGIEIKIAHNIKVADYVPLKKGDTIRFPGEYEYNDKGGVVHWTHRTQGTRNKHPHGWLLHKGIKYH